MTTIKCKAAVAWSPKAKMEVTEIQVAPPKAGQIRIKVLANALCHTDLYTLEGQDPQGKFPCILGHQATAVVQSVGEGVKSVAPGDLIIPCYTPQCRQPECIFCQSNKTNLCPKIRATQGQGLMPDGTSRFSKEGQIIYHFMGCSTFSQYSVICQISAAKINPSMPRELGALLGCGVATGWGAALNNTKITCGSSVVVFGLGAVGLAVIQMAKYQGAKTIVGVDINQKKFEAAIKIGATRCLLSDDRLREKLLQDQKWGYDFTYDCTGNVSVMRLALQVSHRGWGESCVIGVAASGQEISTRPFQLITGRSWKGTAFGGWKSRTDVPKLVNRCLLGDLDLSPYITHRIEGLEKVNQSVEALKGGECLRAVVNIGSQQSKSALKQSQITSKYRTGDGYLYRIRHHSNLLNCAMNFHIFLPCQWMERCPPLPTLYYLSGLSCNDQNAIFKSNFQTLSHGLKMAIVFPDTSPRPQPVPQHLAKGMSAGFYVDASNPQWSQFQMHSYITKQLPDFVQSHFPVDATKKSIMGHSMGGHGAISIHLRNPGLYRSVSALAPICRPSISSFSKDLYPLFFKSKQQWKEWDSYQLIGSKGTGQPLYITCGKKDQFLPDLDLQQFAKQCRARGQQLRLEWVEQMGHSYFFVSSVLRKHLQYHFQRMR